MKISINDSQKRIRVNAAHMRRVSRHVLGAFKRHDKELSIYIVDDAEIRRLNKKYRHADKGTDVLAFCMCEGQPLRGEEKILGDVVISADAAKRRAPCRKGLDYEIAFYLAHGILHLLGFDDNTAAGRKKMQRMQSGFLKELGIKNK